MPDEMALGLPDPDDSGFNEAAYLRAFPDVADAVARGDLESAYQHFNLAGRAEDRLSRAEYRRAAVLERIALASVLAVPRPPDALQTVIDQALVADDGTLLLSGWCDDRRAALAEATLQAGGTTLARWTVFPRLRRSDVEEALGSNEAHDYGLLLFAPPGGRGDGKLLRAAPCTLTLRLENGDTMSAEATLSLVRNAALLDQALITLAEAPHRGNTALATFAALDAGLGDALSLYARHLAGQYAAGAVRRRFGPAQPRPRVSVIVPLYGKIEYFFLQSALFSDAPGIEAYEFIYVLNSPELADTLLAEARSAERLYGLSQTILLLGGNAGFAAACNLGARHAGSDRLLMLNPDVLPGAQDWAARHLHILDTVPEAQSRLFGTTLSYADGALMHAGMYIEEDIALVAGDRGFSERRMLRVEHYGKGAPHADPALPMPRPVPAVTGAFLSIAQSWLERLEGFDEGYAMGHYEDADLCLRSLRDGIAPMLHDIPLLHLEGKGGDRARPQEGAAMLNRWRFTRRWESWLSEAMLGQAPRHAAPGRKQQAARGARAGRG